MKRWLLMLLPFCLGVASCEAPSPCMDEAEVEILLRTDAGDLADAGKQRGQLLSIMDNKYYPMT